MTFTQNTLIEIELLNGTTALHRILWIGGHPAKVATIELRINPGIPKIWRLSDLEAAAAGKLLRIINNDAFMPIIEESNLTKAEIEVRDSAWNAIEYIVCKEPEIYERLKRGILVEEAVRMSNFTKMTIYKFLKRYWIGGMVKNALLPNYSNSGAKGKNRTSTDKKLGRPKKLRENTGIVITEKQEKQFRAAINKYYRPQTGSTLEYTFEHMLKEYYTIPTIDQSDSPDSQLRPQSELPTMRQFRYWYSKNYSTEEAFIHREGVRQRDKKIRPVLHDSGTKVTGPGSVFQIDSTPMDIYLLSRINRNLVVGRPTLYLIIDVFSHLITGYYVDVVEASWMSMAVALQNAFTDKVSWCSLYGISITEAQWPSRHAPVAICADRGEGISNNSIQLANQLNIRIDNAPSGRPDLKGLVERSFKTFNEEYFRGLPGHIEEDHYERGGKDYRLSARLNIDELNTIIIRAILHHNTSHIVPQSIMDEDMLRDNVLPTPNALWAWGIKNRSGQLRALPENVTRYALLPSGQASITRKGVKFRRMHYVSDWVLNEKLIETAAVKGRSRITVHFDPRNMDVIYHKPGKSGEYQSLNMIENDLYQHRTASEIASLKDHEFIQRKQLEATALEGKIKFLKNADKIVDEAVSSSEAEWDHAISKSRRVKNIKKNRALEKESQKSQPAENETVKEHVPSTEQHTGYSDELTWIDESDLDLLEKKQQEKTHGKK